MKIATDLNQIQRRYRVFREEYLGQEKEDRHLYLELRGSRGKIYPYSSYRFVGLVSAPTVGAGMARSGKWQMIRDSDDGREFLFDPEELDFFADVIKAYRKRQMTAEQGKAAAKHLRRYRFKSAGSAVQNKI